MRYLIAILAAVLVALVVTMFFSSPVASWVVGQFSYESPDDVGNLHALVYMAVNVAGLITGWLIGWAIGGRFETDEPVD